MTRAALIPAVALVAACVGCTTTPDRPDAKAPDWPGWASTGSATDTSTFPPTTARFIAGGPSPTAATRAGTVISSANIPTAPRLTAKPTDYSSPEAAAAQYLSVWCYAPAGAAANANIGHAGPWLTPTGMQEDRSRAIGSQTWAVLQARHATTVCGAVTAKVTPRPTDSAHRRCVEIRALRYQLQHGRVVDTDPLLQVRTVLQDADGRWRVDRQERAG